MLGQGLGVAILGKRPRSTWGTETGRDALTDEERGGHRQVLTGQNSPRDNIFPSRYAGNFWGQTALHTGSWFDSGSRSHHQFSITR